MVAYVIPYSRALAYGYEVKSKKLTPYEAPDAALRSTGLPGDTIGPGTYSADKGYAAVTERKLSAVQFDKQAPRKTFRTFSDTVPVSMVAVTFGILRVRLRLQAVVRLGFVGD